MLFKVHGPCNSSKENSGIYKSINYIYIYILSLMNSMHKTQKSNKHHTLELHVIPSHMSVDTIEVWWTDGMVESFLFFSFFNL
jgi:hypothetical protein